MRQPPLTETNVREHATVPETVATITSLLKVARAHARKQDKQAAEAHFERQERRGVRAVRFRGKEIKNIY